MRRILWKGLGLNAISRWRVVPLHITVQGQARREFTMFRPQDRFFCGISQRPTANKGGRFSHEDYKQNLVPRLEKENLTSPFYAKDFLISSCPEVTIKLEWIESCDSSGKVKIHSATLDEAV